MPHRYAFMDSGKARDLKMATDARDTGITCSANGETAALCAGIV